MACSFFRFAKYLPNGSVTVTLVASASYEFAINSASTADTRSYMWMPSLSMVSREIFIVYFFVPFFWMAVIWYFLNQLGAHGQVPRRDPKIAEFRRGAGARHVGPRPL